MTVRGAIHAAASRGVGGRLDGCIQSRALASLYHKFTNACPPNVVPIRSWLSVTCFCGRAGTPRFRPACSRSVGADRSEELRRKSLGFTL